MTKRFWLAGTLLAAQVFAANISMAESVTFNKDVLTDSSTKLSDLPSSRQYRSDVAF